MDKDTRTKFRKADVLWHRIIQLLWGRKCFLHSPTCGGQLYSHHIMGKKTLGLRYSPLNGCCLCYMHHTAKRPSAHLDPAWFKSTLFAQHPLLEDKLYKIARQHDSIRDIDIIIDSLNTTWGYVIENDITFAQIAGEPDASDQTE